MLFEITLLLQKLGKGRFTFGTGNRTGDSYDGDFYQGTMS